MKWLFLIFKLRELKRLHKYNEVRYWGWVQAFKKTDEMAAYHQAMYHEDQMRKLESQIKLLT